LNSPTATLATPEALKRDAAGIAAVFTRPKYRQLLLLLNAGLAGVVLSVANSILLVRLLGATFFGQYAYLLAVTAIIPTFYETFNRSVVRFMGNLAPRRQVRLLLFVLTGKFAVFAVVLTVFLSWYWFIGDSKLDGITQRAGFAVLMVAVLVALPFKLVGNVFRAVLNAHERYRGIAFLTLLPVGVPVIINAVLLLRGTAIDTVLYWLAVEVLVSSVVMLGVSLFLLHRNGWLRAARTVRVRSYAKSVAFGYTHYFRSYGQPLATSVVFNYIKQYLPLILLGHVSTFSSVAYYRVLSSIADLGIEFFPSIAQVMLPSAVNSRARDPNRFAARFAREGALYLVLMGLALLVFTVGHPLLLRLYGLATTPEVSLVALIVSLVVMQAALGFLMNYLFLLGGNTKANYVMSPAHNIFYALCIVLLTPYLLVGMMVARLLHRMFGNVMLTYVSVIRLRYIDQRQYVTLLSLTLAISALLIVAYSLSAGRLR
jgi:O-antigen/teichoic acid export membrane protein